MPLDVVVSHYNGGVYCSMYVVHGTDCFDLSHKLVDSSHALPLTLQLIAYDITIVYMSHKLNFHCNNT